MQTVGNLDKYHAHIITDGQKQLTEVLRLFTGLITKNTAADLGQTSYYLCNLVTEQTGYVFHRIIGVFHHVM